MSDSVACLRAEVLTEVYDLITKDRNASHGNPEDNFKDIANLWNAYLRGRIIEPIQPHDVAVLCLLIKVARIRSSPGARDHWVDIAGYAACGFEVMSKE